MSGQTFVFFVLLGQASRLKTREKQIKSVVTELGRLEPATVEPEPEWFVKLSGEWKSAEKSEFLEKCYKSGIVKLSYHDAGKSAARYTVDFQKMTQLNTVTNRDRQLLRLVLFGATSGCGLSWSRKWEGRQLGPATEDLRDTVRGKTKTNVAERLSLSEFGRPCGGVPLLPHSTMPYLFIDNSAAAQNGSAPAGGPNLFGRYDVVLSPATADYDRDWNFIGRGDQDQPFWVVHAAAINIGEGDTPGHGAEKTAPGAADFQDFAVDGHLDEDAFLEATGQVVGNIVRAVHHVTSLDEIVHLVFFPFGMGAFLRDLRQYDVAYNDEQKMQELRRAMARKFAEALSSTTTGCYIHLCLSFSDLETRQNSDAFLRAWDSASPQLKRRTNVWPDGDSLELAHELANRYRAGQHFEDRGAEGVTRIIIEKGRTVFLVNGANRKLLGNHWFEGRAKRAIDENLHRRSGLLSATSYFLNDYGAGETDRDLETRIAMLDGKVVALP